MIELKTAIERMNRAQVWMSSWEQAGWERIRKELTELSKQSASQICPYYRIHDMVHKGDGLGHVECTCHGRPGKIQNSNWVNRTEETL